jgi:hypothetical protein
VLMLVPVLFGAEVTFGFHGLTALRAERTAAADDLTAPISQAADLDPRAPEADLGGLFRVIAFQYNLAQHDDDHVIVGNINIGNVIYRGNVK